MILKISNTALSYAWGSRTLISDFFGIRATGGPMAEIWLGTHPSHPAQLVDEPGTDLLQKLGHQLPFLLKILAADKPLSIQAHPNAKQAQEGFARENKAGIALDSPMRNYKDDRHKPELIVALADGFEALSGFRPLEQRRELLGELAIAGGELGEYAAEWQTKVESFNQVFSEMMSLGTRARGLVGALLAYEPQGELMSQALAVAKEVAVEYPSDAGVLVTLFMNHVRLDAGQAIAVPAGQVHAYLSGLGVEVMAESDNVLRGGLTKKHIDLPELMRVLVFEDAQTQVLQPTPVANGLSLYPTDFDDFMLYRVDLNSKTVLADLNLPGEGVLLCIAGQLVVSNSLGEMCTLRRGEAAYLGDDARLFTLSSSGTGFFATSTR